MLSRLLNRRRRPTVELQVGDGPFRPGDAIKVDVSLLSDERLFISTGQIQLICTEVYYVHDEEGWESGDFGRTVHHTDIQQALFSGLEVYPSLHYQGEIEFRLPQAALPTVRPPEQIDQSTYANACRECGHSHFIHLAYYRDYSLSRETNACKSPTCPCQKFEPAPTDFPRNTYPPEAPWGWCVWNSSSVTRIHWELKVSLTIPERKDIIQTHELPVLCPVYGESGDGQLPTNVATSKFETCEVEVSVPPVTKAGETINGSLGMSVQQQLNISDVWVSLWRTETAGVKKDKYKIQSKNLHQKPSLNPNETYDWPFSFQIPQGLKPTVSTHNSSVKWFITGTFYRSGILSQSARFLLDEIGVGLARSRACFEVTQEIQVTT